MQVDKLIIFKKGLYSPFSFDKRMLKDRGSFRPFLAHMGLSLIFLFFLYFFVEKCWFPRPYFDILRIRYLFTMVSTSFLISGPVVLLIVFNQNKTSAEKAFDASAITIFQLIVFSYGFFVLSQARPVYVALEKDVFRIVTAAEIMPSDAGGAGFSIDFAGPKVISAFVPGPGHPEQFESIELSMQGVEPSMRPKYWRPYGWRWEEMRGRGVEYDSMLKNIEINKFSLEELTASNHQKDDVCFPLLGKRIRDAFFCVLKRDGSPSLVAFENHD